MISKEVAYFLSLMMIPAGSEEKNNNGIMIQFEGPLPLFVNPQLRPQLLHGRLKSRFQWWTCFFLCNATKHDDNSHKRRNEVNLVAFDRISVQTAKVRFLMSANFDRRNSAAGPLPVLNSSTHWREDEQREKMQFECALLPLMDPSRPSYSIFCLSAGSGDECDSW